MKLKSKCNSSLSIDFHRSILDKTPDPKKSKIEIISIIMMIIKIIHKNVRFNK